MSKQEWPLYEVFIRSKSGLSHRHAGSIHATDDQMALDNARDTYTRRCEGVSLWVVRSVSSRRTRPKQPRLSNRPKTRSIVIQRFMKFPMELKTCEQRTGPHRLHVETRG